MLGAKEFWGIDIGGSAIKAVKIRRRDDELEVAAVDIVALKGEASSEASFGRDRRIWIALHELARRNKIRRQPVVISVPTRATFVRPFDLLLVSGKPTEELIEMEVQQHIPFGLDSVIWDHELFPPTDNTPADKNQEGVLFAVKREVINNYIMSLSAANLNADDIQCSPLALYNYVRHDIEVEEPMLVMDIGATCTDLLMLHDGRYTISSIPSGGDNLTKVLQERFNVTAEQADKAKRMIGKLKNARQALEAILPAMRRYVGEIENAIRRMNVNMGGKSLKKVVLLGGSADTVGLVRMISQTLDCEVVAPKTLNKIGIAPECNVEMFGSRFSEFGVALGLALQAAGVARSAISLITAEATRQSAVTRSKPFAAITLGVVAILLAWLGVFGEVKAGQLAERRGVLARRIAPVEELHSEYRALSDQWNRINSQIERFDNIAEDRKVVPKIMSVIVANLPAANRRRAGENERLWLLSLEIDKSRTEEVSVVAWYGIRARGDRLRDMQFAESTVVDPIMATPGIRGVEMATRGAEGTLGQKYVNTLSPRAPAIDGGIYMVFPVSFRVEPAEIDGSGDGN